MLADPPRRTNRTPAARATASLRSTGTSVPRWLSFASAAGVSAAMPAAAAAAIIPIAPLPAFLVAPPAPGPGGGFVVAASPLDLNTDGVADIFASIFFSHTSPLSENQNAVVYASSVLALSANSINSFAIGDGFAVSAVNIGTRQPASATFTGAFSNSGATLPAGASVTFAVGLSGGNASWIRLRLSVDPQRRYTTISLLAGAYENSGAPIKIGAIPEPSTLALGLLAAGAIGVAALKRAHRKRP